MTAFDWSLLVTAAVLVGFAKTAIGGVGPLSAALFAAVLPARESTGALLPLLLAGDLLAVASYRRHADWPALLRLFPSVAAGVVLGAAFVARVDDTVMRRTIGVLLVLLVTVHLGQRALIRRRAGHAPAPEPAPPGPATAPAPPPARRRPLPMTVAFGLLAGFTTMVANAGGPVMSLYLLAAGMSILGFLGTGAWFFLLVNLFKLPFSIGLGLVGGTSLAIDAALLPALLVGAVLGRTVVHRLDQGRFERLVLLFTALSSINLLR